jgi:hypothetical protein
MMHVQLSRALVVQRRCCLHTCVHYHWHAQFGVNLHSACCVCAACVCVYSVVCAVVCVRAAGACGVCSGVCNMVCNPRVDAARVGGLTQRAFNHVCAAAAWAPPPPPPPPRPSPCNARSSRAQRPQPRPQQPVLGTHVLHNTRSAHLRSSRPRPGRRASARQQAAGCASA